MPSKTKSEGFDASYDSKLPSVPSTPVGSPRYDSNIARTINELSNAELVALQRRIRQIQHERGEFQEREAPKDLAEQVPSELDEASSPSPIFTIGR